jgi:signal transduction histidine kinase
LIRAEPIKDQKSGKITQWIGICTDIQDLKDAEMERKRLIVSEQTALESSKMKSRFLAVMSHEIRTPLFGIIGNTSLLIDSKLDSDQKEQLENINYSAQLLLRVVGDILDFSKIESGKLEVNTEPFLFHSIFKRAENMFKAEAHKKQVSLTFPQFTNTHCRLIGDPNRILQVLTNLVSNSIKFTPEGGSINISCEHEAFGEPSKYYFKVSVEDTGIGIPSETVPFLFSPWTQAKNNSQHMHGSGLGLSISKSLVELMGGSVGLSSQLGVGTICWFELELPIVENEQPQINSNNSGKGARPYEMIEDGISNGASCNPCEDDLEPSQKAIKTTHSSELLIPEITLANPPGFPLGCDRSDHEHQVLIAEDNLINQKIMKKFLGKIPNIKVTMVENGLEALSSYHDHPNNHYCLILLDHMMPVMNGDLVCQLIRENNPSIPIVSVSASTLNNELENFKRVGMSDHLAKPFTSKQLESLIAKWLK